VIERGWIDFGMRFSYRMVAVTVVCISTLMIAIAWKAYGISRVISSNTELARVSVLLNTLKNNTETRLSIGLKLDQISDLQDQIEREKASDGTVLAVDIYNANGMSFYATDRGAIGDKVPAIWKDALKKKVGEKIWQTVDFNEPVFGTHFNGDLGVAGGVTVTVSRKSRDERAIKTIWDLGTLAAALTILAIMLTAGCTFWFASRITQPFRRVGLILAGSDEPAKDDQLEALASQARQTISAAKVRTRAGLLKLEACDDIG
jgi:hypothetical protein